MEAKKKQHPKRVIGLVFVVSLIGVLGCILFWVLYVPDKKQYLRQLGRIEVGFKGMNAANLGHRLKDVIQ